MGYRYNRAPQLAYVTTAWTLQFLLRAQVRTCVQGSKSSKASGIRAAIARDV